MSTSTSSSVPTPSPIPRRPAAAKSLDNADTQKTAVAPIPKTGIPKVKLRLRINQLTHPGAIIFLDTTQPLNALTDAVTIVLQTLYIVFEDSSTVTPTKSITLILREMDGVAYTTGHDLGDEHKEIHFSLDYISHQQLSSKQRQKAEIAGVLVHEMVHCWQWNGFGTAPGGLIEGIADFVRLRAGLAPPHWKKRAEGAWDSGYDKTAYFLEWIEKTKGEGSVMRINEWLRVVRYDEAAFWQELFGQSVDSLWRQYADALALENDR
ncbi:hypothetical protein MMC25_002918 [Agyrium rufum]|nr:hypothetical protein [Agyrium rufum]